MNPLRFGPAPKFLQVPIEALDLLKIGGIGKKAVQDSYGIVGIGGGHQAVARVPDGLEMPWGDTTGSAGQGKIFHWIISLDKIKLLSG